MSNAQITPKIYVINLDQCTDRLRNCSERLSQQGLSFERISACKGDALTLNQKYEHYCKFENLAKYYRPLTSGEIGCYLSHREAWKRIAEGEAPYGIVLEDDIVVKEDMRLAINAIDNLRADWQLIKLAPYKNRTRKIVYKCSVANNFDLVIHDKPMSGCAASAITKVAAKRLLEQTSRFGRPVDVEIQHFWETHVDVYSLLPYPLAQDMAYESTITARKRKKESSFWRRKQQQVVACFINKREVAKQIVHAKSTMGPSA